MLGLSSGYTVKYSPRELHQAKGYITRISLVLSSYGYSITRLKSQYRRSHLPNNGSADAVAYAAVTAIAAYVDADVAV